MCGFIYLFVIYLFVVMIFFLIPSEVSMILRITAAPTSLGLRLSFFFICLFCHEEEMIDTAARIFMIFFAYYNQT